MNLLDPVDAAALRMYNETRAYLLALEAGVEADPEPMEQAAITYGEAVAASQRGEEGP